MVTVLFPSVRAGVEPAYVQPSAEVPQVSSRRPHVARHGGGRRAHRQRPRILRSGFVLPSAAAAAVVVAASGAATADSAPGHEHLHLTPRQSAVALQEQVAGQESGADVAARRQAAALNSAAVQGRAEATQRAARAAKRKAAAEAQARAKAERAAKKWVRPINVWNVTSSYGPRWGKTHDGLDLAASTGTPLYAMSGGVVVRSFFDSSFGNKVEIRYWNGQVSWYAHMSQRLVQEGDSVLPGETVGLVGNTGYSFGSHLHLEVHPRAGVDAPMSPTPWLRDRGLL